MGKWRGSLKRPNPHSFMQGSNACWKRKKGNLCYVSFCAWSLYGALTFHGPQLSVSLKSVLVTGCLISDLQGPHLNSIIACFTGERSPLTQSPCESQRYPARCGWLVPLEWQLFLRFFMCFIFLPMMWLLFPWCAFQSQVGQRHPEAGPPLCQFINPSVTAHTGLGQATMIFSRAHLEGRSMEGWPQGSWFARKTPGPREKVVWLKV